MSPGIFWITIYIVGCIVATVMVVRTHDELMSILQGTSKDNWRDKALYNLAAAQIVLFWPIALLVSPWAIEGGQKDLEEIEKEGP